MWVQDEHDEERGRGLHIVAITAGDGNWGIDGGDAGRAAWFRLNWHEDPGQRDARTLT